MRLIISKEFGIDGKTTVYNVAPPYKSQAKMLHKSCIFW